MELPTGHFLVGCYLLIVNPVSLHPKMSSLTNNATYQQRRRPVACTIYVYDRKFYDRKLRWSLERNYDRTIVILAMAS
jgi:hypothetical protein